MSRRASFEFAALILGLSDFCVIGASFNWQGEAPITAV